MSLDWDVSDIKDYKTVCWNDGVVSAKTDRLIWGCLHIDVGSITEKNIEEVHRRHCVLRIIGIEIDPGPGPVTMDDLRKHIGLKTNVSTKTRAAFNKKVLAMLDRKAQERRGWETKEETR